MKILKFIISQFLLFAILLVLNVILDQYISRPFTYIDLISVLIALPLYLLVFNLEFKMFKRFTAVRLRHKVLFSAIALILAFLAIAILESIWFETTGKMLFQLFS